MSQTYTLRTHQALRGGCPAVLTPGHYTHHVQCPHLIQTLQRVVDEVSLLMSMPGQCSGVTPILVQGPSLPQAGAPVTPTPPSPPGGGIPHPVWGCHTGGCAPQSL